MIDGSYFMILQRLKIELRDRDLMVAELRSQLAAQRVSAFIENFDTPAIKVTLKIKLFLQLLVFVNPLKFYPGFFVTSHKIISSLFEMGHYSLFAHYMYLFYLWTKWNSN